MSYPYNCEATGLASRKGELMSVALTQMPESGGISGHCISGTALSLHINLDRWYSPEVLERLSSPDFGAIKDDDSYRIESLSPTPAPGPKIKLESTSPAREAQPGARSDNSGLRPPAKRQEGLLATNMNFHPPSASQEFLTAKDDGNDVDSLAQPQNDGRARHESSEDDEPIMVRRQTREGAKEREEGMVLRERPSLRGPEPSRRRDTDSHSHERPVLRQPVESSSKSLSKQKKPGPRAWAAKPIMKNDMKAKREVIREIQGYWGQGFIKAYIPKCHRPLVKRGIGNKRSYREHETDPRNWLPSVLKAILMIAKLTDDKKWLKKAMNDVVRYRIKHTGNRKPQLVTTDFDVIEDMLVKDWKVAFSFEIRYKHLLVNRKDQEEDDVTIDNILQAGSDHDEDASDNDDDSTDNQSENGSGDEEDEGMQGRGGVSAKYLESSGYTKAPKYSSPANPRHQPKKPKMHDETPSKRGKHQQSQPPYPQPGMYGYGTPMPGYGPPMDPWGRPMPGYGGPDGFNNGYGGYGGGGYGGYGGYGPPPGHDARQGTQPPSNPRNMSQYPPLNFATTPAPSIPGSDPGAYGNPYQGGQVRIKRESPPDDFEGPSNDIGEQDDDEQEDSRAAADAEVEAMELELKLAKLKAARLRDRKKK
ncbi:hypothetical protein HBI17_067930 [Parastagonospora nodorum]|nr:hypothetical protein HBH74_131710 [Parastagonospora nodorum]KAH4965564.1 hypothetical protein HBH73_065770 [Parastagonospora nodorum]KAH5187081.1 hypothetical protein HBH76_116040 [Parastagonospora nodorum]KAH5484322.1 hypothetical protein HBI31_167240 [Parastagonospora nodorum]KAH5758360.1 hypothetical protein HBI17_067930 [Parastagonospora nodorum]